MGNPLAVNDDWSNALDRYLGWLDSANRPESTINLRSYHLRRFAVTTAARPFETTYEVLERYMRIHPNWSANTRRSVRSTLRSFYRWAHSAELMPTNIGDRLPDVRAEIGHPRPAPEQAVQLGLEHVDRRVRRMVAFAAWAGLRCCEIAVIHENDLVMTAAGWELRVHGKGGKLRLVPLVDPLARAILDADGWLFPGDKAGHLSAAYVSKLVSRALPQGWTAHTLRHRFASAAYSADRDIRAVQELLGHSSVATTQIYTAIPNDNLRRAVTFAGPNYSSAA